MGTEEGVQRFLRDLRSKCRRNNIKIQLKNSKTVDSGEGIRCMGYFCASNGGGELIVAKRSPHWLSILCHESCHLDQYLENSILWRREDAFGNLILDDWLLGKEVENLRKAINRIQSLELDCEKRTIKKIAYYDLPVNTITYIQKANAYIFYYNYVYEVRRWVPNSYDDPAVYLKMRSRFMNDSYYRKLPNKVRKIFLDMGL